MRGVGHLGDHVLSQQMVTDMLELLPDRQTDVPKTKFSEIVVVSNNRVQFLYEVSVDSCSLQ